MSWMPQSLADADIAAQQPFCKPESLPVAHKRSSPQLTGQKQSVLCPKRGVRHALIRGYTAASTLCQWPALPLEQCRAAAAIVAASLPLPALQGCARAL